MRHKISVLAIGCLSAALLTGCGKIDQKLEQTFFDRAGIAADSNYQDYQKLKTDGKLDDSGLARFDDEESIDHGSGTICVSFANNSNLTITYYTDEALSTPILSNEYYLNPGDSIYASEPKSTNDTSDLYSFKEYRIYGYNNAGERMQPKTSEAQGNLVYQIPVDYTGTKLSIMPIGQYPDRKFNFDAYSKDATGNSVNIPVDAGHWSINGEDDTTTINAVESYLVRYDFDEGKYFYVSAQPTPFTKSPNDVGYVEFYEENPTGGESNYTVELHPYIRAEIKFDADGTVQKNKEDAQNVKKEKGIILDNLKYGDTLIITTSGNYTIESTNFQSFSVEKGYSENKRDDTISIVDPEENPVQNSIIVKIYNVTFDTTAKHGTCTYKLDGKKIGNGVYQLKEKQKLTVTYKITDSNYEFVDSSSGIVDKVVNFVNRRERTIELKVDDTFENAMFDPDALFTIVKKEK